MRIEINRNLRIIVGTGAATLLMGLVLIFTPKTSSIPQDPSSKMMDSSLGRIAPLLTPTPPPSK